MLFRGQRLDNDQWVYGQHFTLTIDGKEAHFILAKTESEVCSDIPKDTISFLLNQDIFLVKPQTVGQFVCLDCKGNNLFEGDIVRTRVTNDRFKKNPRFENLVVSYDEKYGRWTNGRIGMFYPSRMEVIGNIFDTPELLKNDKV